MLARTPGQISQGRPVRPPPQQNFHISDQSIKALVVVLSLVRSLFCTAIQKMNGEVGRKATNEVSTSTLVYS